MQVFGNNLFSCVVEDNKDPLKLGRVRIRVVGVHSPKLREVATQDLPWTNVLNPVGSAIGMGSPSVIIQGVWGYCVALNENFTDFLFIGTMSGVIDVKPALRDENDNEIGFKDPDKLYPSEGIIGTPSNSATDEKEQPVNIPECDENGNPPPGFTSCKMTVPQGATHCTVPGESGCLPPLCDIDGNPPTGFDTCVIDLETTDVPPDQPPKPSGDYSDGTALDYTAIKVDMITAIEEEDGTLQNAILPYNHVYQDLLGNVIEIDGTEGNARIVIRHASGARISINKDGGIGLETNPDSLGVFVKGDLNCNGNINVDGSILAKGEITAFDGPTKVTVSQHIHTGNSGAPTSVPTPGI